MTTILMGPPILVQITSISDIGMSAYKLDQTRQAREERIRASGGVTQQCNRNEEEVDEEYIGEGPLPKYQRSMLKFEITDGHTLMQAVEYRKIPEFDLSETPLGYKVCPCFVLDVPS